MDMKLARQVAKLIATKRDLEDELSATKEKLSKLEPALLNELAEEQMDKVEELIGDVEALLKSRA